MSTLIFSFLFFTIVIVMSVLYSVGSYVVETTFLSNVCQK